MMGGESMSDVRQWRASCQYKNHSQVACTPAALLRDSCAYAGPSRKTKLWLLLATIIKYQKLSSAEIVDSTTIRTVIPALISLDRVDIACFHLPLHLISDYLRIQSTNVTLFTQCIQIFLRRLPFLA